MIGKDLPRSVLPLRRRPTVWIIITPLTCILLLLSVFLLVGFPKHSKRTFNNAPIVILDDHDNDDDSSVYNRTETGYLRLPKFLRPSYYKLYLIPHLDEVEEWKMIGSVTVVIHCLQSTNKIVIHSVNLTIGQTSVSLLSETQTPAVNGSILIEEVSYDESRHFYTMVLEKFLEIGNDYQLSIDYQTEISQDLNGFYRSSYIDKESNTTKYLGVTQFEPTYARRAFPCFDEPELKAVFEISIARKNNMTTISNSRISNTEPHSEMNDWVWDHYEPTFPMSTYLVAFVVSDFSYQEKIIQGVNGDNKTFRVWSRYNVLNQTNYVFRNTPLLITFFEKYFDVEFPLPKMDIVTVPDFDSGGMENWGLIIFKEAEMLYDPKITSKSTKNTIASIISHEISHQWFGDLVTPMWWSDIWLNEGFASYFEYVGVNFIEPSWKKMELLVIDELEDVFSNDVLEYTRPISIPVEDPDDIEEQFDQISYSKGASIIGMINHFLTPKTFRNGLRRYLTKWKYGNTLPNDLWEAFTAQAHEDGTLPHGINVSEIMFTWTRQRGFPLIQVTRNYEMQTALFTQSQSKSSRRWWVPISYASPKKNSNFSQTAPMFWISKSDETVEVKITSEEYDWFVVNVNSTGYYRVNYDMRNWQLLANQLKSNPSVIAVLNRAQILDDCYSLAKSLMIPYAFVFSLTEYVRKIENQFSPWQAFLNALQHLFNMLQLTPSYTYFQSYVRRLIQKQYQRINFELDDSFNTFQESLHNQAIVSWACSSNHGDCIRKSQKYFQKWMEDDSSGSKMSSGVEEVYTVNFISVCPAQFKVIFVIIDDYNRVPVNFRKPMYCSIIENGGKTEWDFLWKKYVDSDTPTETKTLIQGLACSKDLIILNKLLELALNPDSEIRQQDGVLVLKEVAINPLGKDLVFNLLQTNWTRVQNYLSNVDIVVGVIGDQYNTVEQLHQLLRFKAKYGSDFGPSQRSVYQTIEKVKSNIQWMSINYKSISNLLKEYVNYGSR